MQNRPPSLGERLRRSSPAYVVLFVSLAATGVLYSELAKQLEAQDHKRFVETAQAIFKSAEWHLDYQWPAMALMAGLSLSLVLFGIAWTQARRRAASERLALHLKHSEETLRQTNEQLETKFHKIARTQETPRESEQNLIQSQCRLKLLNSVLACMATGSSADEIIHRTIDRIREFLPEFRACYSKIDGTGRLTVISSSEPPGWQSLQGRSLDLTAAAEYLAALYRREPMIVPAATEDSRLKPLARTLAALGIRAVLDLPLRHSASELGLLCLHSPEPHEWSEHEIVTLQEVAEHLSIAFRHDEETAKRREAETALAAEKELLSATLRSIRDGIITTDTQARVLLMNRVAEDLTGWKLEQAVERPILEVFDMMDEKTRERIENPVQELLRTGEIFGWSGEALLIARDETERIVGINSAAIVNAKNEVAGAVLVFRDVTERRKLEAEILKASKIESLGLLAGRVAHDFNNILTGILGNVALAKIFAPAEEDLQKRLAQAENACLRARDLTQQLLAFAKGSSPVKKAVSLSALIDEVAGLALGSSNVRSEFSHPPDLWPIAADPGQIRHVLSNLILHAVEAMPDGGLVKMTTENLAVSLESALPLPVGRYVRMTVEDQGIGIRPEHLDKIFDPYFGVKPRSSGLGLATAYLIVKKHGGLILAESELGVGTRFSVYLPASAQTLASPSEAPPGASVPAGRILVMDDDNLVRELASVALSHLGFEAELTADGSETLRRYEQALKSGQPFAAVILDLTVPGTMGARDTVQQLAAIDPNVKAIVSSGYSMDPVMANFRDYGFCGCVNKPYRLEELAKVLRQVIRQNPPTPLEPPV